jgi:hypothetical protein
MPQKKILEGVPAFGSLIHLACVVSLLCDENLWSQLVKIALIIQKYYLYIFDLELTRKVKVSKGCLITCTCCVKINLPGRGILSKAS